MCVNGTKILNVCDKMSENCRPQGGDFLDSHCTFDHLLHLQFYELSGVDFQTSFQQAMHHPL